MYVRNRISIDQFSIWNIFTILKISHTIKFIANQEIGEERNHPKNMLKMAAAKFSLISD